MTQSWSRLHTKPKKNSSPTAKAMVLLNFSPCTYQKPWGVRLFERQPLKGSSEKLRKKFKQANQKQGFQLRRNHARVSSSRFSLPLLHVPHSESILVQASPLRREKVGASRDRQRGILTFNFETFNKHRYDSIRKQNFQIFFPSEKIVRWFYSRECTCKIIF